MEQENLCKQNALHQQRLHIKTNNILSIHKRTNKVIDRKRIH